MADSSAAAEQEQATGQNGPSGRRSTARRELVMNDLLEKATTLFDEHGYEATSLQDIAEAVGISRPALYHYVSSKEDLLTALVDKVSRGLADSLSALRRRTDLSPAAKLTELTALLVRERAAAPSQFRILDRSEPMLPDPVRAVHLQARRDVLAELVAVIEEGIDRGEFKPLDPRTAALGILGMCNWVAWWFRPGSGHDVQPVVRQLSQSALDMLAPSVPRRAAPDSPAAALQRVRAELDSLEQVLPRQYGS
jgi:AcrR family transcriptional regulator